MTDELIVAVEGIALDRGVPMAQIALAWVLRHPVVDAPIVGPSSSPPICATMRVCVRSYNMPMAAKKRAVIKPWLTICITAPCTPSRLKLTRPSIT